MKKFIMMAALAVTPFFFTSCSSSEATENEGTIEHSVSNEMIDELNSAQDLNDDVNQLDEEVNAFIDSL